MAKFLALYTGSPDADRDIGPEAMAAGMKAWGEWMERNAAAILDSGGPLGRTKEVTAAGVADIRNRLAAYVIVDAPSHEAAASLFEGHPHFTIFPGHGVEIMPCLEIPRG